MKAGLVLLMIISAVLMFATTVYADEGATTHNATYVMKDAKGNAVGLATFTEDVSGLIRINVNASGMTPGLHPQ